jgi:hypothetical protein
VGGGGNSTPLTITVPLIIAVPLRILLPLIVLPLPMITLFTS